MEGGHNVVSTGTDTAVCALPVHTTSSGTGQSRHRRGVPHTHCAFVAATTVVSPSIDTGVRLPTTPFEHTRSVNDVTHETSPPTITVTVSDCLEDLRNSFREKGFSSAAAEMATNRRR